MSSLLKLVGTITKKLPNTMFKVKLTNNSTIICYLSGKLRINYIKVIIGDRVRIELDKTNTLKGRIINRLNESQSIH